MNLKLLVRGAALITFAGSAMAADDISAILKQIKSEQTGSVPKPQAAAAAAPKKKKSSTTQKSSSSAKRSSEPRIPIWSPRDKLPKDVTGHYLAGDFVVQGEDLSGCATIIPLQDAMNPFARQFNVVNMSTGLVPGTLVPMGRREMVRVSRSRPLVFIGRGILPGIYQVQAQ
jgi:hypothetical protein